MRYRIAWLAAKIEHAEQLRAAGIEGPNPNGPMLDELIATAQVFEAYEAAHEKGPSPEDT